jgi:pre-mRNA branch site protein p14
MSRLDPGSNRQAIPRKLTSRFLFVRNLPFKATSEELYDLFGKYGAIRQIRQGNAQDTRGTAFVVFGIIEALFSNTLEDINDAQSALKQLQGFQIKGRYLVLVFYDKNKVVKKRT